MEVWVRKSVKSLRVRMEWKHIIIIIIIVVVVVNIIIIIIQKVTFGELVRKQGMRNKYYIIILFISVDPCWYNHWI
jgi:hypothetical protein